MLISLGMPKGPNELANSSYWRAFYGLQIPFCLLILYLHTFVYVEEPIDFSVKNGQQEEAMQLISKVYNQES